VTVRLICIPSSDSAFAAAVDAALAAATAESPDKLMPDELQRRVQVRYPGALVRPRESIAAVGHTPETVWYVTNRPFASRLSADLEVPVPVELAFRIYVERVVEWQNAVRLRPIRLMPRLVGSEYAAHYELFGRVVEGRLVLVGADPPRSVRFEANGLGIRAWYMTSFAPSALGSRLTVVGDYDVPIRILPKIADRLFVERTIQRQIDAAHQALLELCWREHRRLPQPVVPPITGSDVARG
jgi:hypothetical protein